MPSGIRKIEPVLQDEADEDGTFALAVPDIVGIVLNLGVMGEFELVRSLPNPPEGEKG